MGGGPGHQPAALSLWQKQVPLRTHSFTHPPCQLSQGQGHQACLADVPVGCVSVGIGGGRGEAGSGDRMGVGQHLLICITTDTLLDQENGARNNRGGGGSLGGSWRFSFLASNPPHSVGREAGGQALSSPIAGPWQGRCTHCRSSFLRLGGTPSRPPTSFGPDTADTQPWLNPSEQRPLSPPSSGNPLPGGPLAALLTPALPTLFSSVCICWSVRLAVSQGRPNLGAAQGNILHEKQSKQ